MISKKCTIPFSLSALLLAVILGTQNFSSRPTASSFTPVNEKEQFGLSTQESKILAEHFQTIPAEQRVKEMRKSFLKISLKREDRTTDLGLASLADGLDSGNESVRGAAILMVESLIIDASQLDTQIDVSNKNKIHALFALYKVRAENRIAKMREDFPNSPALKYLKQI